jgi:putative colanic acid biosynthesis acetyltransferase WcaF
MPVAMHAPPHVDVSAYQSSFSFRHRLARLIWSMVWLLLFRPSPWFCYGWRRLLLRVFGAKIGKRAIVHSSARIWAPWNLEMEEYSCLSSSVDCYCVAKVLIGAHATVSQYSFLCTASHDISDPNMKLTTSLITIGAGAWVCADVFVGPGVTIGEGAIAGARASVFKDVAPWTVVGGNPAKVIGKRELTCAVGSVAHPALDAGPVGSALESRSQV